MSRARGCALWRRCVYVYVCVCVWANTCVRSQDGFLKVQGIAETGGQAKVMIQDGMVTVNGEIETRRGRKLLHGDTVLMEGDEESLRVEFE